MATRRKNYVTPLDLERRLSGLTINRPIIPSQSGNAGRFLSTNGSQMSWQLPTGVDELLVNFEYESTSSGVDYISTDATVSDIQDAVDDGKMVRCLYSDGGELSQGFLAYLYGDECFFFVMRETGAYIITYTSADQCTGAAARYKEYYTEETLTITASSWSALSGQSPFLFQCTVNTSSAIANDAEVELINDLPVTFANHGFVLVSVTGNSVTIYAFSKPSSAVNLKIRIR